MTVMVSPRWMRPRADHRRAGGAAPEAIPPDPADAVACAPRTVRAHARPCAVRTLRKRELARRARRPQRGELRAADQPRRGGQAALDAEALDHVLGLAERLLRVGRE